MFDTSNFRSPTSRAGANKAKHHQFHSKPRAQQCQRPQPSPANLQPLKMSEDDRYRTSTQYRLWSYSPQSLFALRSSTNQIAADRVREAVRRVREARNVSSADTSEAENGGAGAMVIPEGEVDCLTVEEELKLVAFFCRQTISLGDHLGVPTDVKVCYTCLPSNLHF